MNKVAIVLFAVIALSLYCEAKIYTRCDLVQELRRYDFPASQMNDWVCLIEAASGRNTAYLSQPSSTGSRAWGLFKIWDYFWEICNIKYLEDVMTENLQSASNCARLIQSRYGFNVWVDWLIGCTNQPLPDISDC